QLPLVHVVQSVIDRVGEDGVAGADIRARVSRSGGFKALAGFVLLLVAVVVVVWLAVGRGGGATRTGAHRQADAAQPASGSEEGGAGK
ncbi:MAG: hypothetical protein D6806_01935, partial [Deltaproteobacteria bacterium]